MFWTALSTAWAIWIIVGLWLKWPSKIRVIFKSGASMNPITSLNIQLGLTSHITAEALDQDGKPMIPQPQITFVTVPSTIASFTADPSGGGVITALAVGSAVLQASVGGVTGNLTLNILPPPQVLTSIVFVSP